MKKDTSALLSQIAQAKPSSVANMTGSQPVRLSGSQMSPETASARPPVLLSKTNPKRPGRYKGVYWPEQELENIRSLRRKLFLEGLEVSENLLIRALIRAGQDSPRLIEIVRQLDDE
jgi:hypothetical protein